MVAVSEVVVGSSGSPGFELTATVVGLAGCTPLEWLAEELPSVHDALDAGPVG